MGTLASGLRGQAAPNPEGTEWLWLEVLVSTVVATVGRS